jgi:hypothetical protein
MVRFFYFKIITGKIIYRCMRLKIKYEALTVRVRNPFSGFDEIIGFVNPELYKLYADIYPELFEEVKEPKQKKK